MKHKINCLKSAISVLSLSLALLGYITLSDPVPETFPDQPVIAEKFSDSPDSDEGIQPLSDWDEDFKKIEE